jgi:hypothetical protein
MRAVHTGIVAIAIILASAGSSAADLNSDVERCDAGLDRSIVACGNMHSPLSGGWNTCVNTAVATHRTCMMDAVRRMQTRGED